MPRIDQLIRSLQRVKPFGQIPEQELRDFILAGQIESIAAQTLIFHEEAACSGLYVLLAGQVQLCRHSAEGHITILAVFDPVIMFNEVAALDGGANPVTAIAGSASTIWRISSDRLSQFLSAHALISLELLKILAGRNRLLVNHLQNLSFYPVQIRTAKLLLELSNNGSQPVDRRRYPNHQLAARIATVPEAFSRALKALRESGAIEATPQSIFITRPQCLTQLTRSAADKFQP